MKLRWSRWRAKISNKNRNANYAADPSVVTGREDTCIWNLATIIFSLSPMLVLICTIAFIQVSHCEEGQILQQLTPASSTCAWTSYEHTSLIHVIIGFMAFAYLSFFTYVFTLDSLPWGGECILHNTKRLTSDRLVLVLLPRRLQLS